MPSYQYRCKNNDCCHEFLTHHSIKADFLRDCPACNNPTLVVVIHAANAFVRNEPKTLAMLAERNTANLGQQGAQEMWGKMEERKQLAKQKAREELAEKLPKGASLPTPDTSEKWYRPGTTKPMIELNNLSPQQAKKYIETGEK